MPTTDSPDQLLENAVGRLIRQGSGVQLRAFAERPGSKLDIGRLWALLQVYRFGQAAGQARLGDIAEHVRVPREILEPAFDRLASTGYAERSGDVFWLTPAGAHQVELVRAETMEWLTQRLIQSSGSAGPTGSHRSGRRWSGSRKTFWCNGIGPTTRPRRCGCGRRGGRPSRLGARPGRRDRRLRRCRHVPLPRIPAGAPEDPVPPNLPPPASGHPVRRAETRGLRIGSRVHGGARRFRVMRTEIM